MNFSLVAINPRPLVLLISRIGRVCYGAGRRQIRWYDIPNRNRENQISAKKLFTSQII